MNKQRENLDIRDQISFSKEDHVVLKYLSHFCLGAGRRKRQNLVCVCALSRGGEFNQSAMNNSARQS
jgi:hypothetical protein